MNSTAQWPSPGRAWTMVALLTVAYVVSYVDRYILGLLIEPIKADLTLSDEQIGYLIGPAFAIFYATMGLPLGWLADRSRRTWLVAAGIALWSLATAASGLAKSYGHLLLARISVGVGEATLSPAAMSMISDSFPPERRGKPVAFYAAALSLGAGIASLISAGVLFWAKSAEGIEVPGLGAVKPWQFAFIVVGLPGVLLSLAFLWLPEPPRQAQQRTPELTGSSFASTFAYVGRNLGTYGGLVMLVCVMTITAYSHGFMPSAFVRTFGWETKTYALVNGLITLAVGPATVALVGIVCDRWRKAGRQDAPFVLLCAGFVVMLPTAALPLQMPSPVAALMLLAVNTMSIGTISAAGMIAWLDIAPAAIRGQLVALYYMVISIAGLGLGPTTVGVLSTRVFGEAHLGHAVSAIPVLYGVLPLLLIPLVRRRYLARMAALVAPPSNERGPGSRT